MLISEVLKEVVEDKPSKYHTGEFEVIDGEMPCWVVISDQALLDV